MIKSGLTTICALIAIFLLTVGPCTAEPAGKAQEAEKAEKTDQPTPVATEKKTDELFELTVPEGFKQLAPEEPGIRKWAKGNGEILVIVGNLFSDSPEVLYEKLLAAAKQNKRYEAVEKLDIPGTYALAFREKKSDEAARLRSWRIIVLGAGKIFNVDFAAPESEFESFLPGFQAAQKSFKLRHPIR